MRSGRGIGAAVSPRLWGRLLIALIVALSVANTFSPAAAAQEWSAPRTVFVTETGQTADGYFLDVWRTQRSLLGDPITAEIAPRNGYLTNASGNEIIQYFENLALVYLPGAPVGEQVDTLKLGADALNDALSTRPTAALTRAARRTACPPDRAADCRTFAEAGHTLRGAFLEFWNAGEAARWLGPPVSEAFRAADGSIMQYLERGVLRQQLAGPVELMPLGLTTARRQGISTAPVPQPADIPIFDEALFVPPPTAEPAETEVAEVEDAEAHGWAVGSFGPGPQQGAWKEIVVSISMQAMWAYEGDQMVISSYVSTGTAEVPETETPIGYWSVLSKYEIQDMEGTISDEYYFVPDVPDILYFDNLGNALHGTYWHNNFGTPMSHGCVNLPLDVAAWLFDWAPVGTAVTVIP